MKVYKLLFCFMISITGYTQVSHSFWLGLTQAGSDILGDSSGGSMNYYLDWKLKNSHTLQARVGADINFDESNSKLHDARLRHRFDFYSNDIWKVQSELRVYLPFSEGSQDNKGIIPRVDYSVTFSSAPKFKETDFSAVFYFKPMYTRNFNDTDFIAIKPDDPLSQIKNTINGILSNQFIVALNYSKFYLELYFSYNTKWDSVGRRVDDEFATAQDLYFTINDTFQLMVGHFNGSSLYNEQGQRQTLSFDSDQDIFYVNGIINF